MDPLPKPKEADSKKQFESYYRDYSAPKDAQCGYSVFRGAIYQFLARKNSFILVNGLAGCLSTACFAYFSGSISSIEKLYGIPSQKSGILSVGNDISQVMVSLFIAYHLGRRHRPRWMGIGMLCLALYSFIAALPHFIYGSGKDVLMLTREHGQGSNTTATSEVIAQEIQKAMCQPEVAAETLFEDCQNPDNYMPQIILFIAQIVAGVGNAIYSSLSSAYLDDNIQKSKAPWVISVTQFIKLFGPAFGYALASFCLKIFVEPSSTPLISPEDPRWIGAWWIGMLVLGVLSTITAFFISLFPKKLPRYVAKLEFADKSREDVGKPSELDVMIKEKGESDKCLADDSSLPETSDGFKETTLRILKNKIFMLNLIELILYFNGCFPYWIFLAKYIEVQYRVSASEANLFTGVLGLVFSALGVLSAGIILSKFKPSARTIVIWNVITTMGTCLIYLSFNWLGCEASDQATAMTAQQMIQGNGSMACSSLCNCDFVKYTPVCGEDGLTYISPCHAGCTDKLMGVGVRDINRYTNCSCVVTGEGFPGGYALPGSCKVDCWKWNSFYMFMALICLNNFLSCSGIAGTILLSVRCVLVKDKTFALGLKFGLASMLAFIPSPIIFGAIMDSTCIFWGKTECGEKSNCWIYDGVKFRFSVNTIASLLMFLSTVFNAIMWFHVKKLSIFDEEVDEKTNKSSNENKELSTVE